MTTNEIQDTANELHHARLNKKPVEQFSQRGLKFSRDQAYAIQEAQQALRLKMGEAPVGLKMGLTSEGKRRQMNLDSPLYGELTDKMWLNQASSFSIANLIHPKIEPEIAFRLAKPLSGQITRAQALEAIDAVAAALEILDSRYQQFKYFSMEDVIADNSSSSHFVVGPWKPDLQGMKLDELAMKMFVDEKLAQFGSSKEISGDPVNSLIQLCQLLAARDRIVPAGSIILTGAATAAVALEPGMQIRLEVDGLPNVAISIAR